MSSLVLKGGRVVDPGSGRDEVTDLRVVDGKVAALGPDLVGDVTVDVTGLIVGPGFVDLHSHVHSIAGQRLQALDGVTTALDLEAGLMPVARAYQNAAREGRPLHYGFSASWGGSVPPTPGAGPWVLRVEVKDQFGALLGRNFLEIAKAPLAPSKGGAGARVASK